MYYSTTCSSPVGMLTLASDGNNLTGLWIEGQKYHGNTMAGEMVENKEIPVFERTRKWLDNYFAGGNQLFRKSRLLLPEENSGRRYGKSSAKFPMAA